MITPNTQLLLGPDPGDGAFRAAAVKSIHYKRLPVGKVGRGGGWWVSERWAVQATGEGPA